MTEKKEIERLRNIEREELGKISMGPWGISFDGRHKEIEMAISSLEEIQQYRALGTIKELREATEKQRAKKPKLYGDFEDGKLLCPNCEEDLMDLIDCGFNNCPYCGQSINWSEEQ